MHFLEYNALALEHDYLLITRLPNWHDLKLKHSQRGTVTIVGGTHGVGTSAVRHLFTDKVLLKKILLKTAQYDYWQVLLTATGLKRTNHPRSKKTRLVAESLHPEFFCEPIYI